MQTNQPRKERRKEVKSFPNGRSHYFACQSVYTALISSFLPTSVTEIIWWVGAYKTLPWICCILVTTEAVWAVSCRITEWSEQCICVCACVTGSSQLETAKWLASVGVGGMLHEWFDCFLSVWPFEGTCLTKRKRKSLRALKLMGSAITSAK